MAEKAQQRIQAVGRQLTHLSSTLSSGSSSVSDSGLGSDSSPQALPIQRKAGPSSGLRAERKVVIITGANSPMGIGRATAHQFAESGARAIYICDLDDAHLESHRRELNAAYPTVQVHVRKFDAGDENKVKAVVDDAMARYKRLDVFFANAGITGNPISPFTDFDEQEFMQVIRLNSWGFLAAAKHAAPAMAKTSPEKPTPNGSIIGTASVAGLRSNAGSTSYSASKAAVISMAQTIAYQLAGTGIRINAICPGLIETGMTAVIYEMARARGTEKKIGQLNPAQRGGYADEIARVALFLGSDESSYVNGQAWAVDGGLSAGHPYVIGKMS